MKKTVLFDSHQAEKAKLGPFGGFILPIWFTSLKSEHLAVRKKAGMFDISHMGLLFFTGEGTFEWIQSLTCNNIARARSGTMVYSMLLNESGGILEDIMVGCVNNGVLMVVNASNKAKVLAWILPRMARTIHFQDLNQDNSFIAIQGPQSAILIDRALGVNLIQNARFSVATFQFNHTNCIALRTGYTGEDGFELIIPNSQATQVWQLCAQAGVSPCGLAARDSLRVEAGLPLYGHELSESITPAMTRYRWVVKFDHDFIGRSALEPTWNTPPKLTTVGLKLDGKLIARDGYSIEEGGYITSGSMSPTTESSIAMALVPPSVSTLGSRVHIQIRGSSHLATVVEVPFK